MREDDDAIDFVRLLNRIIILCAVIIAVPVILWTITTFVRNQPKLSILLATASINTPGRTTIAEPTQQPSAARQAKLADPEDAGATERAAPEGALLIDHPPDASPSVPSAAQIADTSSALAVSNSATPIVAKGAHDLPLPSAANYGAAAGRTDAVAPIEPAGATEAESGCALLFGPASRTDPAATAETSQRGYGPHGGSNAVTCPDATTPAGGRRLRRGNGDHQPIRSSGAAIAEARRPQRRDIRFSRKVGRGRY